jgi:hypothetical protein
MAQAVSRRPLTAAAWVRASRINPLVFVVDKVAVGQVFLRVIRFYPVSIIPPCAPHSLLHLLIHFIRGRTIDP